MSLDMSWIDWDFDYGDQLAKKYMKFREEYYDIGTICKIKGREGPVLVKFLGWDHNYKGKFEDLDNTIFGLFSDYTCAGVNDYCLEIIVPIKPNLQQPKEEIGSGFGLPARDKPPSWDVDIAWIWYVAIMAIGLIFKDRWLIWSFTSAVFFLWKNGFLNGGNKK